MTQDFGHTSNASAVRHAARAKLEALGQERSLRRKSVATPGKRDLLQHLSRLTGTPLTSAPVTAPSDAIETATILEKSAAKAPNIQVSDLSKLPGAGPGLIWMLNSLDIQTLNDIAALNAESLRNQLGSIGAVLNVQAWIDFAKTAQTPETKTAVEQVG